MKFNFLCIKRKVSSCPTLYLRRCGSSGAMFSLDFAVEDEDDEVDEGRRNPTDCGDDGQLTCS